MGDAGAPERCEVAVVGASPAGLRAAWAAARGGAGVTLLEAREEIGVPEPFAAVAFDFLWKAAAEAPPRAVRRRLRGVRVAAPCGREVRVRASALVLDRTRFDRHLAAEAESEGARVRTGVRGLRLQGDRCLAADGFELRPQVVVFADGAATLARGLLEPVERPHAILWGAALEVPMRTGSADRYARIGLGSHAPGGRSQLTPLGRDRWAHWTFYRGEALEGERRARLALARDARHVGWPAGVVQEARFRGVAPDPVFQIPRTLVADGALVAGGAAGQGGLEAGLAAGELAGEVAAAAVRRGRRDVAALWRYEREWKGAYLASYRAVAREVGRLARLDDDALDRLLAPWFGRTVAARDLAGLVSQRPLHRLAAGLRLAAGAPSGAAAVLRTVLSSGGCATGTGAAGSHRRHCQSSEAPGFR